MKKIVKQLLTSLLVVSTLIVSQITLLQPASAAEGDAVDIFFYVGNNTNNGFMQGQTFQANSWIQVCANGTGSLKSFDVDTTSTGLTSTSFYVQDFNADWNNATDIGSINGDGIWTGQIDAGQCLSLGEEGTVTGEIGTNLEYSGTIASSTLLDDSPNVDPNLGDNSSSYSKPIIEPVYSLDLVAYVGDGSPTVSQGFTYTPYLNICAWGLGSVTEFDLDIQTTNYTNVSFNVQPHAWSNQDVNDKGVIDSSGHWTGNLQHNSCVNLEIHLTGAGEIGQNAAIAVTILSSKVTGGTNNPGQLNNGGEPVLTREIVIPVEDVDLNMYVGTNNVTFPVGGQFSNAWGHVCSSGYGTVEEMTFRVQTAGWTMTDFQTQQVTDQGNNATDPGEIVDGVWMGELEAGQCLVLNAIGPITGAIGEDVSWTITIESSKLFGGAPNPDSYQANQTMGISKPVGIPGDLAIQTRLVTSGEIEAGSTVSYEIEIQNVGAGVIPDSQVGLYYVLPEGASLIGVVDSDLGDALSLVGCQSMGPISEVGPAFSYYSGEVIQCLLDSSLGEVPAGASYPFVLKLEASGGFSSGETEVYGVVLSGNISEPDSFSFTYEFNSGRDGFQLPINNIMHLVYDANELAVTINRCEGVSLDTSVDDACFTVQFNKPVWAASFDVSDLVLVGGGNVYSFVQNSSTKWTVQINGMTPGGTLQLLLGASSVSDYSAVQNGVEVLGENVIRFSGGTKAATGNSGDAPSASTSKSVGSGIGKASSSMVSLGIESGAVSVVASDSVPIIGAASGLVAEIPRIFSSDFNKTLLLGKWSFTQNNVLDFAIVLVNLAGLAALIIVALDRRKQLL